MAYSLRLETSTVGQHGSWFSCDLNTATRRAPALVGYIAFDGAIIVLGVCSASGKFFLHFHKLDVSKLFLQKSRNLHNLPQASLHLLTLVHGLGYFLAMLNMSRLILLAQLTRHGCHLLL